MLALGADPGRAGLHRARRVGSLCAMTYLWVALGGALGSVGRFWLASLLALRAGEAFPWGTLAVNVLGSFLIGFFGVLTGPDGRWVVGVGARQFFMIGVCGGFTTFSSFSLQTLYLVNEGQWLGAAANVVLSVVLCLAAVGLGCVAAGVLNRA